MISTMLRRGAASLLFVTSAFASPFEISPRAISTDLLDNFKLYAQFAAVAACDQNINSTGHPLTCDQGPCDLITADETEIIDKYHGEQSATGFIALDHTRKLIVVTFRGTVSKYDGHIDTQIELVNATELCTNCTVHKGFWEYWNGAKEQITTQLHKAKRDNKNYGIAIVGHSLGGGVATLAGTVLRKEGFELDIWTFGSPRPGNYELAEYITEQRSPVSVYRSTHLNDSVPSLPWKLGWWEYSHPSPEFWINQPTGEVVTPDVVKVVWGIDNPNGNLGQPHPIGIDASHGWYFGNISVCATPADGSPPADSKKVKAEL